MIRRIRICGWLILVTGALMLAIVGSSDAWAYGPGGGTASVSASVSQQPNGQATLTVSGSGYGPNETVQFEVFSQGQSVGATKSSVSGTISTILSLPGGLAAGQHTLTGTGTVSGNSGSTNFVLALATTNPNPCPAAFRTGQSGIVLAGFYSAPCAISPLGTPHLPASPGTAKGGGLLPITGAQVTLLTGLGAGAVGVGGLLVLASRRRRSSNWS